MDQPFFAPSLCDGIKPEVESYQTVEGLASVKTHSGG
jgi:hypothetical protein